MPSPLFEPRPGIGYDDLRAEFRWSVPDEFNLGVACVDGHPEDAPALVLADEARTVTFGWLSDASARLAGALATRGVNRGDRVGIVAPQSLATGLSHLALWKLGAVSLPLASVFGPDALRYRIHDAGCSVALGSSENVEKVREAAPSASVIDLDRQLSQLLESAPVAPTATLSEDPAYLIYTSGTTGPPKGALHAHRSLFGHLPGFELYYEFAPRPNDLIWTPADWAWIGGLMDVLIPAWYYGIPVLTTARDFDPHDAVELMREHGVTLAFLPPTALKMMRAAAVDGDGLSLRAVFSGGEPLGEEMHRWSLEHMGVSINEGYGQTEANLVVGNCGSVWPVRPGSMGKALPGHDVEIHDEAGKRVIGETGEVCVRSPDPVLMLNYWRQPEATAEKVRDGWLLTGDLAREDDDGYFWFVSRKDDVISSMGYRIGPGEIEESLLQHPAVAMCAVVGEPDELRGEIPVAYVVPAPGAVADDELVRELQTHVRTRLAAHEVPRRVMFLDDLPRTTTGKLMRRALRFEAD